MQIDWTLKTINYTKYSDTAHTQYFDNEADNQKYTQINNISRFICKLTNDREQSIKTLVRDTKTA